MIGFAGGPQRGKVNEIEKQGSLLCHFGGVVNGDGLARRVARAAYARSHITHAIIASVSGDRHVTDGDVATGCAVIPTDHISADACTAVAAPGGQLVAAAASAPRLRVGFGYCICDSS